MSVFLLLLVSIHCGLALELCYDGQDDVPEIICEQGTITIIEVRLGTTLGLEEFACITYKYFDKCSHLSHKAQVELSSRCNGYSLCYGWYIDPIMFGQILCEDGEYIDPHYILVTYTCKGNDSSTPSTTRRRYSTYPIYPTPYSSRAPDFEEPNYTGEIVKIGLGVGGGFLLLVIIIVAARCAVREPKRKRQQRNQQNNLESRTVPQQTVQSTQNYPQQVALNYQQQPTHYQQLAAPNYQHATQNMYTIPPTNQPSQAEVHAAPQGTSHTASGVLPGELGVPDEPPPSYDAVMARADIRKPGTDRMESYQSSPSAPPLHDENTV